MKAEFSLMVEARPSTAEFMWFWIGDKTALANKARNLIITQSSTPRAKLRSRRSITPLKAISTSVSPWLNRVKQTSSTSNDGRMTFTLTFREVTEADYGIYMCQVNHKAGNREFYFELKRQSGMFFLLKYFSRLRYKLKIHYSSLRCQGDKSRYHPNHWGREKSSSRI